MVKSWVLESWSGWFRDSVRPAALLGLAASIPTLLAVAIYEHRARIRADSDAQAHQAVAERQTRLREEERRGRIRAEQQLRTQPREVVAGTSDVDGCGVTNGSEEGFVFHPIGTFQSCYKSRCGTPRQGGLVSGCLAVLQCTRDLNHKAALEGLADFSHCWVLYVFHENTNLSREGRTTARRRQTRGRVPLWQGLCMKIAPPRCPDLKVGVLACRTPHRPNPVGLSLARIVRIDMESGEVILAGLDVVDGTPCLDLKPYLPAFESVPNASMPSWVQTSYEEPLMHVEWSAVALQLLEELLGPDTPDGEAKLALKPFASFEDLRCALQDTLALDIRSPLQKKRHPNPVDAKQKNAKSGGDLLEPFFVGDLWFHELHVIYSLSPVYDPTSAASASVRIEKVEPRSAEADMCTTASSDKQDAVTQ